MLTTETIALAQIVKSKAGRDKGRVFIVTEIVDESYVHVVDGDLRMVDRPKRKKIKHLQVTDTILRELVEAIKTGSLQDAQVRKTLDIYKK
ncbi:MAG: KOW domain-containing RNA-binding protein [Tissierellales bacterium]|jgi:ribosomal protein L14E/L6E/L27E|nr:KOW domain-containing RNA-binding protein [Tissierellales bacterium]